MTRLRLPRTTAQLDRRAADRFLREGATAVTLVPVIVRSTDTSPALEQPFYSGRGWTLCSDDTRSDRPFGGVHSMPFVEAEQASRVPDHAPRCARKTRPSQCSTVVAECRVTIAYRTVR